MTTSSKPVVMYCDDERELCDLVAEELEFEGFRVVKAYGGVEALQILKQTKVDALITDVRMPQVNGLDLLKHVKKSNPIEPIVIFVTGFADVPLYEAYDEGAEAVFSKPIDYAALMSTLKRLLVNKDANSPRRHERFDVTGSVAIHFDKPLNGHNASLTNIGRGGCFVAIDPVDIQKDEVVGLTITIDNKTVIKGSGICRWVRKNQVGDLPAGVGLEFANLDNESKEHLLLAFRPSPVFIPKA